MPVVGLIPILACEQAAQIIANMLLFAYQFVSGSLVPYNEGDEYQKQ